MCSFSVTYFVFLVIFQLLTFSSAQTYFQSTWFPDWKSFFDSSASEGNQDISRDETFTNNQDFPNNDDFFKDAFSFDQDFTGNQNNATRRKSQGRGRYGPKVMDQDVQFLTNVITNLEENARYYQAPTDARQYLPYNHNVEDFGTFDFIIVGAGASGSLIANRLSEVSNWKILLIEAGDYGDNITDIPNMYFQVEFTPYNWGFQSVPQTTSCLGMQGRRCPLARGKGVGGTTLINGLVYSRGSKIDFERWANQVEDARWSYDQVLPYFKRTERFDHRDSEAPAFYPIHGKTGLLNVEYHLPRSPQLNAFLRANEELGIPIADYNSGTGLGASPAQVNTNNGRTHDTGTAFILPVLDRPNLTVMTNSYATKILINRKKEARGILFSHNNILYKARASKEVILSGGSYQSPQLLMLSGIGPRDHLESFQIPVVQDLEVGSTLRDHACYYGLNFRTNYAEPIRSLEEYVEDFLAGYGPLAAPGNNQGVAFYESQFTRGTGYPDFEIMFIPANATNDFAPSAFNLTDRTYEDTWRYINRTQTYILYLIALHAQSIGTVRLQSNDPYDYPVLDTRFLSDPDDRDIRVIYEAVQLSLQLAETKAFQEMGATLQGHPMRACRMFDYPSEEYWYCAIRQMTMDIYHPVGTNPMGPDPRKGAVVDSECRVHGVQKLRVADASVFPFTLAGHPVAGITLVGEMVSDFIKQTYDNY